MGKVIFWIVVVFVVLFALRLYSAAKAKARRTEAPRKEVDASSTSPDATMVRCVNCGVFLPKSEALPAPTGYRCGDPACAERR